MLAIFALNISCSDSKYLKSQGLDKEDLTVLQIFYFCQLLNSLTLSSPIPDKEKKINLNFYFRTSL